MRVTSKYSHPHYVDLPGFEPRLTEPKSEVLPLHHRSVVLAYAVQMYTISAKLQIGNSNFSPRQEGPVRAP